jgi:trigger factor
MDVKVEQTGALTRKLHITLEPEMVTPVLDKEYRKIQKDAKFKGFRKGKVPRSVIEKSYREQVQADVAEKLVQDTYFEIVEKEDLDPVVHPQLEDPIFNEDGSFSYVAVIDVRPVFELGEYTGLEVEKSDTTVTEGDIEFELKRIQRELAPLRTVDDRPVVSGDLVVIDYQGYYKGNPMKHVRNNDVTVDVGAGMLDKDFEEKLIGMTKSQQAEHEIEYPERHPNPILAGKRVQFQVVIKDVKERALAEIDDEFAKDVNENFTSLDMLKEEIRGKVEIDKKSTAEGELNDRIMNKLLEHHDFEVPERLVRYEIQEMIKNTEEQLEKNNMSLESAGLNKEELAKQNEPVAQRRVRGDFILKKIAEVEEIKVTDEDLDQTFAKIGTRYNMDAQQVKSYFQNRDDLLPLMNEVLNDKILTFLKQSAVLIEPAEAAAEGEEQETESQPENADSGDTPA